MMYEWQMKSAMRWQRLISVAPQFVILVQLSGCPVLHDASTSAKRWVQQSDAHGFAGLWLRFRASPR